MANQLNLPQYGAQKTSVYSASTSPQISFEKVPSTLLVDDEKSNSGKSESLDIDVWMWIHIFYLNANIAFSF